MTTSKQRYDKARADRPSRGWYKKAAWKRKRINQLRAEPNCRMCKPFIRPARNVDHVIPHREDWLKFWNGELQSLCDPCHNEHKQREELEGFSRAIGDDGFPIDPRHPFGPSR